MEKEYKLNRLETTKLMGPMVDKHWAELRTAKERGERVGWCSGPMFIFPYAMDMKCHFMAGYAAYCAGRGAAEQVLEAAESVGELLDTCSYHRLHMGMAAAIEKNIPVKEEVLLPMPDLLIIGRFCTEMSHYAEGLYRRYSTPVVAVDMPPPQDKEDIARLEKYVEGQIRGSLIPEIERVCGRPFDYDRMSEILSVLKQACTLRNECWEFAKVNPTPWTLWDYGVSIAPIFYMMGKPESVTYYTKLRDELAERVEKKIPVMLPDGENYRLYWDSWLPWAFLGKIIRSFTKFGAVPICGRYPWEFFDHPEDIEPEPDPVRNWVQLYYTKSHIAYHASTKGGIDLISKLVEDYSIDGLVMLASKTCRFWQGQVPIINHIEKKYGIPGILLEIDQADASFYSDAQVDTRLQALFEMIDGRRRVI